MKRVKKESATLKLYNTKEVQLGNTETWKVHNTEKFQHGKSATG